MNIRRATVISLFLFALAVSPALSRQTVAQAAAGADSVNLPAERHLKNVRQLTFGD